MIGVFDSGIGGLTVVREIASLMPSVDITYLGDTARVPYGVRSPETVRRYALEGASFLMSKGISLLVVACNTVSAVALDEVIAKASPVPVIGVILPGARAAASATRGNIGVIGTEATVRSGAYTEAIKSIRGDAKINSAACPLFVPLVEEGWLDGEVPELVASRYLAALKSGSIDTLVLGCTHYPLLKPMLGKVMGPSVTLIDSATETAREVQATLGADAAMGTGKMKFHVTDSPAKFAEVGGRFLGRKIEDITKVELEAHA